MVHHGQEPPSPPSKVMQVVFLAWVGLPLAVIGGGAAGAAIASGAVPVAAALLGGVTATVAHHYLFSHWRGKVLQFNLCTYVLATLGFNYVRLGIDAFTGEIKVMQVTTFQPEEREGEDK